MKDQPTLVPLKTALELYQTGYNHGALNKPPMTDDEVIRLINILDKGK